MDFFTIPATEYNSLKKEVVETKELVKSLIQEIKAERALKNESYLSTAEAIAKYKISKDSLYRRKSEGFIEVLQTGNVVRWPESQLQKLFKIRK